MNEFWWLFYYALSSGNPRVYFETFKLLNITIIDEFNLQ